MEAVDTILQLRNMNGIHKNSYDETNNNLKINKQ
jgi:hypothetical protein